MKKVLTVIGVVLAAVLVLAAGWWFAVRPNDQQNGAINALQTSDGEQNGAINALQTSDGEQNGAINALQTSDGEQNGAINALQTSDGEQNGAINALQTSDGEQNGAINALGARLDILEGSGEMGAVRRGEFDTRMRTVVTREEIVPIVGIADETCLAALPAYIAANPLASNGSGCCADEDEEVAIVSPIDGCSCRVVNNDPTTATCEGREALVDQVDQLRDNNRRLRRQVAALTPPPVPAAPTADIPPTADAQADAAATTFDIQQDAPIADAGSTTATVGRAVIRPIED